LPAIQAPARITAGGLGSLLKEIGMSKTFTRLVGAAAVCAAVAGGMASAQNTDPSSPAASTPANTQPTDQRFNTGSNSSSTSANSTTANSSSSSSTWNADGTQAPRSDRH
jgi:hypothetical protein